MKIIIPMSGRGQRFVNKGYEKIKPLIEIDGKPIIAHVVDMFSSEDTYLFICANDHLEQTDLRQVLEGLVPNGTIVGIDPHKKGPIYAVQQVYDLILDGEEVIVNYCDFGTYWDYEDFLAHTRNRAADGAIPAYKGFHPHMLGTTNYAFMRDEAQWMLEIQEKMPFTDNRMNEYASSGTYYFRTGEMLKKYMDLTVAKDLQVNGEYYVSVVYNLLVADGLKVSIYEIQHMLQWGTPEDVEDYLYHSNYFKKLMTHQSFHAPDTNTVNLIPLAGEGQRFKDEGYETPKPLIALSGKEMILQAHDAYPKSSHSTFVVLKRHCDSYGIDKLLSGIGEVIVLDQVTEGQAITAALGVRRDAADHPLLIAACDNGLMIDPVKYEAFLSDPSVDVVCFSFKNNPTVGSNPKGYGYLITDASDVIKGVSVKQPISATPMQDHAIVGAFYFKSAHAFLKGVDYLKANNIRVNNEFYIDSIMGILDELHLKGVALCCDYESWGTPNDYKTYCYWQSFFHKADFHPYRIDQDPMFPPEERKTWMDQAVSFSQKYR